MKQFILKNRTAFTGLVLTLVLGTILMSFQDSPLVNQKFDPHPEYDDTIPEKDLSDHMKLKDLDKLLIDLDGKIMAQVGDALKSIDFARIEKDVELSVKSIDVNKILDDVKSSLKNVDMKEIHKELEKARLEIEKSREALKNINQE